MYPNVIDALRAGKVSQDLTASHADPFYGLYSTLFVYVHNQLQNGSVNNFDCWTQWWFRVHYCLIFRRCMTCTTPARVYMPRRMIECGTQLIHLPFLLAFTRPPSSRCEDISFFFWYCMKVFDLGRRLHMHPYTVYIHIYIYI